MGKRLILLSVVFAVFAISASSAWGAFPGRNGELVVATHNGVELVSPSTGRVTPVCTSAVLCGRPVQPRFSPNGQAIAFIDSRTSRLVVVAPDGSCLWCLLGARLTSRTGSRPAFTSRGWAVTVAGKGLSRVSLTTGGASQVARGRVGDAVWSSRGALAFVRDGWVWVGRPGHGKFRRLAPGRSPSFSPDGSEVVLVRHGFLWIVRARDGGKRRLVKGTAPAWSPNGRQVAYIGPGGSVEVVSAKGGHERRLRGVRGTSVDWQPLSAPGKPGCVPKGSTLLSSTPDAVIFQRGYSVYGCLRALGQARLMQEVDVPTAFIGLAGRFAALEVPCAGRACSGGPSEFVWLYDLGNGNSSLVGEAQQGSSLDSLALDSSGFVAWRETTQEPKYQPIGGLSCPSNSLCVAGDDVGDILSSTDPTGGASAWNITNPSGTSGSVTHSSCASTSLCVVPRDGDVLTSTNPAGDASAWTSTTFPPLSPVSAISCPSNSLCVAGDNTNDIITSTDPTANTWTGAHLANPPGQTGGLSINSVSCPSTSLCVATWTPFFIGASTSYILTSTNPTGGAGAWTSAEVPAAVDLISCPSANLCVAVDRIFGNVLTSTNPTGGGSAWSTAHISDSGLLTVSCPSASLCVAGDGRGNILTSTNPTGGASAWSTAHISGNSLLTASCPSASLCVVGDGKGNILTSTNPTGGASTWTSAAVDIPPCARQSTPCISEQLYAHDDQGTRPIDSVPAGNGNAIGSVNLLGDSLTLSWTHNRDQRQLQLG